MVLKAPVRVAVPQVEPCWLDKQAGTQKVISLIDQAAREGAQLIAFGELFLPGYPSFLYGGSMNEVNKHAVQFVSM
jgi:nitrilase